MYTEDLFCVHLVPMEFKQSLILVIRAAATQGNNNYQLDRPTVHSCNPHAMSFLRETHGDSVCDIGTAGVHDKGDNQAVKTQNLCENEMTFWARFSPHVSPHCRYPNNHANILSSGPLLPPRSHTAMYPSLQPHLRYSAFRWLEWDSHPLKKTFTFTDEDYVLVDSPVCKRIIKAHVRGARCERLKRAFVGRVNFAPVDDTFRWNQPEPEPCIYEPHHIARCMYNYGIQATPFLETVLAEIFEQCGIVSEFDWAVVCALISVEPSYEKILQEAIGLGPFANWDAIKTAITTRQLLNYPPMSDELARVERGRISKDRQQQEIKAEVDHLNMTYSMATEIRHGIKDQTDIPQWLYAVAYILDPRAPAYSITVSLVRQYLEPLQQYCLIQALKKSLDNRSKGPTLHSRITSSGCPTDEPSLIYKVFGAIPQISRMANTGTDLSIRMEEFKNTPISTMRGSEDIGSPKQSPDDRGKGAPLHSRIASSGCPTDGPNLIYKVF
ncbi:hypothetical protein CYLTODRAFT_477305, partial [Cylindrobasidium torrendii FP15055 ss-10]